MVANEKNFQSLNLSSPNHHVKSNSQNYGKMTIAEAIHDDPKPKAVTGLSSISSPKDSRGVISNELEETAQRAEKVREVRHLLLSLNNRCLGEQSDDGWDDTGSIFESFDAI